MTPEQKTLARRLRTACSDVLHVASEAAKSDDKALRMRGSALKEYMTAQIERMPSEETQEARFSGETDGVRRAFLVQNGPIAED